MPAVLALKFAVTASQLPPPFQSPAAPCHGPAPGGGVWPTVNTPARLFSSVDVEPELKWLTNTSVQPSLFMSAAASAVSPLPPPSLNVAAANVPSPLLRKIARLEELR